MTLSLRMSAYLEALTQVARERQDALALADDRRTVSYRELHEEIEARAHGLVTAGLRSADRVAIVAENSADYVLSVLAIWKADGVPVTIYPSTSEADLALTLRDADPVLVLCDESTELLTRTATGDGLPVARLEGPEHPSVVSVESAVTPEHLRADLSLICYSSGTTSRPKAIMLSAKAVANTAQTFSEVWHLDQRDVTLVCLPMAWLFGLTTATLATLYAGGTVVSKRRAKPELIAEAVESHGVTFLPAVTTVLAKLANYLEQSTSQPAFGSLRLIVSGGEPRNERAFARLRTYTGLPVHDNYCASEMQPLVTYDPATDPEPRAGSAGRVVPRSELRIVDESGEDVRTGEIGEGLSRGPGIMLGYWNDDAATRDALTSDGWYRTKDLLRMDEDGYVYVVGRASDMIIRGGSNVSPGEVEERLRHHPDVLDLAVVGAKDPLYGEEVVAVVQLRDEAHFDRANLQDFARSQLSGFKVPTRFLQVDQLPLNATTGKVNRKVVKKMLEEGVLS